MAGKNSSVGQTSSSFLLLSSSLTKIPMSSLLSPLFLLPNSSPPLPLPTQRLFPAASLQETLLPEPPTSLIATSKGIEAVLLAACNFLEDPPLGSLEHEENQAFLSKPFLFDAKSDKSEESEESDWEDELDNMSTFLNGGSFGPSLNASKAKHSKRQPLLDSIKTSRAKEKLVRILVEEELVPCN